MAAAGRPAILVPYPLRHRRPPERQRRLDARAAGAASVIADAELDAERLQAEVAAVLEDPAQLEAMAAAARGLAKPDAARRIADEVLEAAQ